MSWHCSQALVAEFSEVDYSDGVLSAPSRSTPIAVECSCKDKTMECSIHSRFGITFGHLMQNPGAERWMSSLADSPAKTFLGHGTEKGLKVKRADCGLKCTESSKSASPSSSSSKMSAISESAGSTRFTKCSKTSGMNAKTEISSLPIAERPTYESGHGFSRAGIGRQWCLQVTAPSAKRVASQSARIAQTIIQSALASDPALMDGDWKKKIGELLPTLTAQDAKNNAGPAQYRRNTYPLNVIAGGPLNPEWVEWLMGWPIGWTDLQPLEMGRFQQWQKLHGK